MISGSRTGGSAGGLRSPQRTKLRRRLPSANDRQLRARVRGFNTPAILAVRGQSRRLDSLPVTSGLPSEADIVRPPRHVRSVPIGDIVCSVWNERGRVLGPVENQDSPCGLVVIQALDGTIRTDRRPMGEDGAHCLGKPTDPGRSGSDNRRFVEAVLWIVRTGSPWRDLPPFFGNWNTVFKRYRDWVKADVFTRLFEACSDTPDMEYAMVDATIVKVHRHGQGAKGGLRARPSAVPKAA
jgi:transposase